MPTTAEEKGRVLLIGSGLGLDTPFGHNTPPAAGLQFVARVPLMNKIEMFTIFKMLGTLKAKYKIRHYHAAAGRAIGLPELPLGGEPLTMLTEFCSTTKIKR